MALSNLEGTKNLQETFFSGAYDQLNRIAGYMLRRENATASERAELQPQDLVHEAYLRLFSRLSSMESELHFLRIASHTMRLILVDRARRHHSAKRGGSTTKVVSLEEAGAIAVALDNDYVALKEGLNTLRSKAPAEADALELMFFMGLTLEETSELMGVSRATAERDIRKAKCFMKEYLLPSPTKQVYKLR